MAIVIHEQTYAAILGATSKCVAWTGFAFKLTAIGFDEAGNALYSAADSIEKKHKEFKRDIALKQIKAKKIKVET
jgi:phosphoribosylamine-glycine ligase